MARPDEINYQQLSADALADVPLEETMAVRLLTDPKVELLSLVHAAYAVRQHYWGKKVQIHILNNAQNGQCPEDCSYCTQAKTSDADIEAYPIKSDDEILGEAKRAYEAGAHRYCMVFAGRGPNNKRTQVLADLVRKIKSTYPIEVCVSAGLLDDDKAQVLAEAGLDRLNHNLNTSREHYSEICTTHTYDDRVNTLRSAKKAGLETCSGMIVGMGETANELIEVANTLREMNSASVPVNFLLPFEGNVLREPHGLTPDYCLRILSVFRLIHPRAELRCGAGREFHLGSMEVLSLYPANSLFLDGYLNGKGAERKRTLSMIRDAGFEIVSDQRLDELIEHEPVDGSDVELRVAGKTAAFKTRAELRPAEV